MSRLWLASHVLLWMLVLVQAVLLVALMRQVGTLLLRVGTSSAFDAGDGPNIGVEAPWIPIEAFDTNGGTGGRRTMLVFVSVGCGMCDVLAPGLNTIASAYKSTTRVFAVGREGEESLASWARRKRIRVPVLSLPDAFDAYNVSGTPYAYVVDSKGILRAGGGVNSTDQMEQLLRQCVEPEVAEKRAIQIVSMGSTGGDLT